MFLTDILAISEMASSRTPGSSFVKSSYAASNASCQSLGNLLRRLLVYTSHMCFTTFSLSSISCFHENPSITRPLTLPHICNKIHRQNSCAQTGKKNRPEHRDRRDGKVEVVGNMVEVPGRPPESNRACEHGPESKEQNRSQCPELVPTPPKNTHI